MDGSFAPFLALGEDLVALSPSVPTALRSLLRAIYGFKTGPWQTIFELF